MKLVRNMEKNFFFEISSLREARVVRFAAVNINIYGILLEKFRIMCERA